MTSLIAVIGLGRLGARALAWALQQRQHDGAEPKHQKREGTHQAEQAETKRSAGILQRGVVVAGVGVGPHGRTEQVIGEIPIVVRQPHTR